MVIGYSSVESDGDTESGVHDSRVSMRLVLSNVRWFCLNQSMSINS